MNNFTQNSSFFSIQKPGRYTDGEWNLNAREVFPSDVNFLLAFPDVYEIGASYHGFNILYGYLSALDGVFVDRVYAPWFDYENYLRSCKFDLTSISNKIPMKDFDIIGFSLQYELNFTNILNMLDLAGIRLRSDERDSAFPIIIGGGECAYSAEAVAPFFDAFVIGDGEDAIKEIVGRIKEIKKSAGKIGHISKKEILDSLSTIDGIYIPSFYKDKFDDSGKFLGKEKINFNAPEKINRRFFDFASDENITNPIVPLIRIPHDRFVVEIKRGCGGGCRFCRAGMIGRPVRERSADDIISLCLKGIFNTGLDEIGLLSLSSTDHSAIGEIIDKFQCEFSREGVSLSLPSLRIESFDISLIEKLCGAKKTGLTFAPEAGSFRLRRVINKPISDEKILSVAQKSFEKGWQTLKFYFMVGLPTETYEDLDELLKIVEKTIEIGRKYHGKRAQLNVTLSPFIPKPHTPFQWEGFLDESEILNRVNYIKRTCRSRLITFKYHNTKQSMLESALCKADSRFSNVVERAFMLGARFDAWDEGFDFRIWRQAGDEVGLPISHFAYMKYDEDDALPWSLISGNMVSKDYLINERHKALLAEQTAACEPNSCVACGICDSVIKPRFVDSVITPDIKNKLSHDENRNKSETAGNPMIQEPVCKIRFFYSKTGDMKFVSHLDMLRVLKIILRRANIPIALTQGFNPQPKMQLTAPMPLGYETMDEFFDCFMVKDIKEKDFPYILKKINSLSPAGLQFKSLIPIPLTSKAPEASCESAEFEIYFADDASEEIKKLCISGYMNNSCNFAESDCFFVKKLPKGSDDESEAKIIDLKASMKKIDFINDNDSRFSLLISLEQNRYIDPLKALSLFVGKHPPLSLTEGLKVIRKRLVVK